MKPSKRGPPTKKRVPAWVQAEQHEYQQLKALTSAERLKRLQALRWPDRAKQASSQARCSRTGWGGQ